MRRLSLIFGILGFIIALQLIGAFVLAILIYQITPNRVLAEQTFIGRMPGALSMVRVADRAMNIFYRGSKPNEPLQKYSLDIDKDQYRELLSALPTNLPSPWYGNLYLMDENKVWADAVFTDEEGETYDVEVRVRGDIFNHWAYNKKSWRVKFSNDKLFHGMSSLNLILPEDRGWFAENLNVDRARKFNLLHPPIRFVTVSVNGSGPLLYTEIEHWNKNMLEKQKYSGDVNLYSSGGGNSYFQQWNPVFDFVEYWEKNVENPASPDNYEEVEQLIVLSKEGAHEDSQYLERLKSIVDVDHLVSWYAISLLAGSRHVTDFNVRMFFDTSTGKFQPIPWDIHLYAPRTLLTLPGNKFLNEVFRVPTLRLAAYNRVWEYIQDDAQIESDLQKVDSYINQIERYAYRDSLKINSNRQVKKQIENLKSLVSENFNFLKNELKVSEVLVAQRIPDSSQISRGILLKLELTSRGVAAASLDEIHIPDVLVPLVQDNRLQLWRDTGDGVWDENDISVSLSLRDKPDKNDGRVVVVKSGKNSLIWPGDAELDENGRAVSAPYTKHIFFLVSRDDTRLKDSDYPLNLDIKNAVTGKKADVIGEVLLDERTFENLWQSYASREDFLNRYPFFRPEGENGVYLSGNYTIQGTVVVPTNIIFRIEPGTVIRMGKDASILSYSSVNMIGSQGRPIVIEPENENEPWGVFAVLNAKEPSKVKWINASGGGEATINGTKFSGMIAFHNSPVTILDSVIQKATGDDGLNLKYVYVDINRVRFEENAFDGLDIDMALSGVIENSLFINNGNDGIDISGSPLVIRNTEIEGSSDKCISVGEQSTPLIYDTTVRNCHYGLAVKDDSHAKVERMLFEKNDIAIGAYIKKNIFQAPSVTVTESVFTRNEENILALSGAVITIDSAK
ncbi:MAG: CotH kinase family protein [Candidatus Peribacteraceae bacterium]|nr:CotH kinase family protein [Candidatus Peribacteraceae bacterium]